MSVSHPNIRKGTIEHREYQMRICESAMNGSTLVVLGTGLGKTVIASLVIAKRYVPGKRVLVLAPTRPLVEQHARELSRTLTVDGICPLTGSIPPGRRASLWKDNVILVSTPQVVLNDLTMERIRLNDVNLIVFDEAHRAVGNYAYVDIASIYRATVPESERLVLGMTASPGSSPDRVREVCDNLGITRMEVRSDWDPDVAPYVPGVHVDWVMVDLPEEMREVIAHLNAIYGERVDLLRAHGFLPPKRRVRVSEIIASRTHIMEELAKRNGDRSLYTCLVAQAVAMKVNHAIDLAETQGRTALAAYLERLANDASRTRANRELASDPRFRRVMEMVNALPEEHPKVREVVKMVTERLRREPGSKVMVFTQYRDTCHRLVETLTGHEGVIPVEFIGQAAREGRTGLSQKEQEDVLRRFRSGEVNTLVSTSVGEEGLDIPSTDMVIFYEPVPSEIRTIQRRGRTGRRARGVVKVLVARGTRDEAYLYSARAKERRMRAHLEEIGRSLRGSVEVVLGGHTARTGSGAPPLAEGGGRPSPGRRSTPDRPRPVRTTTLESFTPEERRIEVIVDHREFSSGVIRRLFDAGVRLLTETLDAGDYILSDRVGVERKSSADLRESIKDGRLFVQARELRMMYPVPIIIVEGERYALGGMSDASVAGALVSLLVDYRIPVLTTSSEEETARLILAIAKSEQSPGRRPALRRGKSGRRIHEWQRFIVEGLPMVSSVIAERMLKRMKSVRRIANASVRELMEIEGIGEKRASEIVELMNVEYLQEGDASSQADERKGERRGR